jgi:nucleotide-binding universal stress UspA family protein
MATDFVRPYRVMLVLEERTDPTPEQKTEIVRLIKVGRALANAQNAGSMTVLALVGIGEGQSLSEGVIPAQNQRTFLEQLIKESETEGMASPELDVKSSVRVCQRKEMSDELNDAVNETKTDLLLLEAGWFDGPGGNPNTEYRSPLEDIMRRPLCDLAVIGGGVEIDQSKKILLAARGGPFAELALRLASGIAESNRGEVTLLHVVQQDEDGDGLDDIGDDSPYAELEKTLRYRNGKKLRRRQVVAPNVQEGILQEAEKGYNLVFMGASVNMNVSPTRTEALLLGSLAQTLMHEHAVKKTPGVIVVRTAAPRDFYFARLQRKKLEAQILKGTEDYISKVVDKWFAENTFDAEEFSDIERLVASKKAQGLTISLGLPALNEEATIGNVISSVKELLFDKYPLLDELVLIDSQSSDRTVEIARELGVPVHIHQETLPSMGARRGKGEALWKSLYVLKGDIICWIDTDIINPNPRFVYGLLGPLLKEPRIQYVKGYYRRPLKVGDKMHETGGGRVTELTIRPLFNLFYPELSGFIQPLAGEYAGRRSCLEQLPFFTGYGVETGHLIDMLERFGLSSLGQVNLRERQHRNQELGALSQMAFAITQVVMKRLEEREKLRLTEDVNRTMKLISLGETGLRLDVRHIEDRERPPMLEVPEYRQLYRKRPAKV